MLGHTSCGAVKGACDNVELGKLTGMLDNIKPAIKSVEAGFSEKSSKNAEYVQAVSDANVLLTIKAIKDRSEVLSEMIDSNEILVVGAMYNVATGEVVFN